MDSDIDTVSARTVHTAPLFCLCSRASMLVMHPPPFLPAHRLSDWPDCRLELHCCKGVTVHPVRMIAKNRGDRSFAAILTRLRCMRCGKPPAPVYLCAGHREANGGASADWAIELVPGPR